MRQKTQTPRDAALHAALVNMRYGMCTPADLKILRSLKAGHHPGQPRVAKRKFRNVAIICGLHAQKDRINELGSERFAEETGQKLIHFYSIDKWGKEKDPNTKQKYGKSKASTKTKHQSNEIDFDTQCEIWKVRHGGTEHFPGKLSLCIDMPVMLRNNDATELCITKGQEGYVAGWNSSTGPHGKRVLETVFVRLHNPPSLVQIPGLPDNVIPIVRNTKTITCTFPSDLKESLERQQVWVLPNFAMTAHASQGKSRPENTVHLNSCFNHMAYYTALSRSTSASGTIIIQGFDDKVINSGCSGYLRQEFRELEILDEVTTLRYEGKLPRNINGSLRNPLIRQFQKWKGVNYVPSKTDAALRWSSSNPLPLLRPVTDNPWTLIGKGSLKKQTVKPVSNSVAASGSQPIASLKNKMDNLSLGPKKKSKITPVEVQDPDIDSPQGLTWDSENWSCAYDAIIGILYNIWIQDPSQWNMVLGLHSNVALDILLKGFEQVREESISLEDARDEVRHYLHQLNEATIPEGAVGTSVAAVAKWSALSVIMKVLRLMIGLTL